MEINVKNINTSNGYNSFAKYYDTIIGDRSFYLTRLKEKISRHIPGSANILELGCGTGTLISELAAGNQCTGIDLSEEMLAIAAEKGKTVQFIHASMVDFYMDASFDVIICVFETLNGLSDEEEWRAVFSNCRRSLKKGGILIFDMFTPVRLKNMQDAITKEVDGSVMHLSMMPDQDTLSAEWYFCLLRPPGMEPADAFTISARTFPLQDLLGWLEGFRILSIEDFQDRLLPITRSERLLFVLSNDQD